MIRRLAFLLAWFAVPAGAQDSVILPGRVDGETFYRALACAAQPGQTCRAEPVRWAAARPIRVALRPLGNAFLGRPRLRAHAAVKQALKELNAARAGFRLALVAEDATAEIEIFFRDVESGQTLEGSGSDGNDALSARDGVTRLEVDPETGQIAHATLLFTRALRTADYESAVLRALARAMGLLTGIDGPAYAQNSIFSTEGSGRTTLAQQDIDALRRHYARN